jgi:hypothetical protein
MNVKGRQFRVEGKRRDGMSTLFTGMKNRIMKHTKIILQRGKTRKSNRGVNTIKVHYIHIWKYHNKTPL